MGAAFAVLGALHCRSSRFLAFVAVLVAGGVMAAEPASNPAEEAPGRTVESIRSWVLGHNPELRALSFEAEAAAARPGPAGALPDPMLGITRMIVCGAM